MYFKLECFSFFEKLELFIESKVFYLYFFKHIMDTGFVLVLESFAKLWKLIIPYSRTWEVLEKGSKRLWKSFGFLCGKFQNILK